MLVIVFLFLLFSFSKPVIAIEEFNIHQKLEYRIDLNGDASVVQEVELINNLSEIYPKEYQIKLLGTDIKNIIATDNSGSILQSTDKNQDTTLINLKFNQSTVGKNKATNFKLNYLLPQAAKHKGNIWEISLPESKDVKENENIEINIYVPTSFGNLSFASVKPQNTLTLSDKTQLFFNIKDIKNRKMFFIFGNYQLFDFDIKYFLNNPSSNPIETEIAIPPETDSQKVVFKKIDPQPKNIKIDSDGNWLAVYQLEPQQEIEVNVTGQTKIISSTMQSNDIDLNSLTQPQLHWPSTDPAIIQIANDLKTPKDIYDYVINTLSYDYNQINSAKRKGALDALLSPTNSLCTEFTDLFVTLARAKKIPAREIEGFAYTNDQKIKPLNLNADILHAWPQYYDSSQKNWISIDPTWAKTTNGIDYFTDLDLNHFIFVIHGVSSQYPPPPGSYKNNRNIKTVVVNFAQKNEEASYQPPKITPSKLKFSRDFKVAVSNPNFNSISNLTISSPLLKWEHVIKTLPPYAVVEINIPNTSFIQSLQPKNQKVNLSIDFENISNPINYSITNPSHYLNLIIVISTTVILLSISGIILTNQKRSQK